MDPYDVLPYDARPVGLSHPAVLGARAAAARLDPVVPAEARVLELGAADGSNVLPMAYRMPGARFVAVERSVEQARVAEARREALGLSNVRIVEADLAALDPERDVGPVDYVIAHGLYSWVPDRVREAIWELCARCLTERGLFFVSYNALPGWAVRGELRRALRAAVPDADVSPREALAEARRALDVLAEVLREPGHEHAALLAAEVRMARSTHDSHLLHEYLAPHNRPFRLEEVVDDAARHGLRFVDELAPLSADGVRELHVQDVLARAGIEGSGVVRDWTDLLLYRQFRRTLFAKGSPSEPDPQRLLETCHFGGMIRPRREQLVLDEEVEEVFETPSKVEVRVRGSADKVALLEIWDRWPSTTTFPHLLANTRRRLERAGVSPADALSEEKLARLRGTLVALIRARHLETRLSRVRTFRRLATRPIASRLTRLEVEWHPWVTSAHHEHADVNPFEAALIPLCDGSRTVPEIIDAIRERVAAGELRVYHRDRPVRDPGQLREVVPPLVGHVLARLLTLGLLVEEDS